MPDEEIEPKTDDLKTIFAWKIPRGVFRYMDDRPNLQFFIYFAVFCLGMWCFGWIQLYFSCMPRNEACSYYQCVSHTEPTPTRHK